MENGQAVRLIQYRDEPFEEFAKPICPVCKVPLDVQVSARDRKVYLRKRCGQHGWFETLLFSDEGW